MALVDVVERAKTGRVLVIGTSPISLLIALTASRIGHRVTIVERSDHLGGAWACDEIDGQLVDRACHLMEPLAPARRWIFDQLGEEPSTYLHTPTAVTPWNTLVPIPSRRYRALEVTMAWPAAARHVLSAIGGDRTEFRRVLAESGHDIGRLTRRAVRELRSGPSPAMTFSPKPFSRLCAIVTDVVPEIRLCEEASKIVHRVESDDFLVSFRDSEATFDFVAVPSGADINIVVAGQAVHQRQFHYENHHLLFEATAGSEPLSYLAFMANPHVRRVVDTGLVGGAPERHRFLAHTRGPEVTVDDVVKALAGHRYVDGSQPAELVKHYRFTSTRTIISGDLPTGLWTPDTYGDLTDNLAQLLVSDDDGKVRLDLPFVEPSRLTA